MTTPGRTLQLGAAALVGIAVALILALGGAPAPAAAGAGSFAVAAVAGWSLLVHERAAHASVRRQVIDADARLEEIRESESLLRQAVGGLAAGAWLWDLARQEFLYTSPATVALYGRSIGGADEWRRAIHPEDRARVVGAWERKPDGFDQTYRLVRTDGRVLLVRERTRLVRDTKGEPWRVVGMVEDVTEHARLQSDLHEAQQARTTGEVERILRQTQEELAASARRAGHAEASGAALAGVARFVGSVEVAAGSLAETLNGMRPERLERVVRLLREHEHDLADFLVGDPRGRVLPTYLVELLTSLLGQRRRAGADLLELRHRLERLGGLVRAHKEEVDGDDQVVIAPSDLLEEAVGIAILASGDLRWHVDRRYQAVPPVQVVRRRVLPALVALLVDARDRVRDLPSDDRRVELAAREDADGTVLVEVSTPRRDGLAPELAVVDGFVPETREDGARSVRFLRLPVALRRARSETPAPVERRGRWSEEAIAAAK